MEFAGHRVPNVVWPSIRSFDDVEAAIGYPSGCIALPPIDAVETPQKMSTYMNGVRSRTCVPIIVRVSGNPQQMSRVAFAVRESLVTGVMIEIIPGDQPIRDCIDAVRQQWNGTLGIHATTYIPNGVSYAVVDCTSSCDTLVKLCTGRAVPIVAISRAETTPEIDTLLDYGASAVCIVYNNIDAQTHRWFMTPFIRDAAYRLRQFYLIPILISTNVDMRERLLDILYRTFKPLGFDCVVPGHGSRLANVLADRMETRMSIIDGRVVRGTTGHALLLYDVIQRDDIVSFEKDLLEKSGYTVTAIGLTASCDTNYSTVISRSDLGCRRLPLRHSQVIQLEASRSLMSLREGRHIYFLNRIEEGDMESVASQKRAYQFKLCTREPCRLSDFALCSPYGSITRPCILWTDGTTRMNVAAEVHMASPHVHGRIVIRR